MKKILLTILTILTFTVSRAQNIIEITVTGSISAQSHTISCSHGDSIKITVNATATQDLQIVFGQYNYYAPNLGSYMFKFQVDSNNIGSQWVIHDWSNTVGPNPTQIIGGPIIKSIPTSIHELSKLNVNVFPNPTSDYINIESMENIKNVELYDMYGKLTLTSKETKVDVTNIAKGTYTLKVNTDKSVGTKTVILN